MRISDWSSDVCSSDLGDHRQAAEGRQGPHSPAAAQSGLRADRRDDRPGLRHRGPVLRPGAAEPVSGGFPTACGNVSPRTRGMYDDFAGPVSGVILLPGRGFAVLRTRAEQTAPKATTTPTRGPPT